MDNIAISIIIPVYNAENFLRKGLESCVNQTLQNIEIICVNDASKDNSSLVIEEYVNKYPGKVVHISLPQNRGQGGARNEGILRAKGEFLCFMDSDDYLDVHLCEDAYMKIKENDADMVFYDFIRVDGEREYPVELVGEDEIEIWYQQIGCALWLQMIRKEIILRYQLFLPENTRADDDAMIPLWRFYAKKKCKLERPYYFYVNRTDSLVNEVKLSSIIAPVVGVIPYRYRMMQKMGLLQEYMAESDWMIARDIYGVLRRLLKYKKFLTIDNIDYMKQKLNFLGGHILDDSIIKYNLSSVAIDMVKTFLYYPEDYLDKYNNKTFFVEKQIEWGLDRGVERKIKQILFPYQQSYKVAIWGAGVQGIPIISTLIRMGYNYKIFDSSKQGEEVWESANKYIEPPEKILEEGINVILVTSDFYYKAIENQIHTKYPWVNVLNLPRMIRNRK